MVDDKILFVCTGNICRSPMAEYLFNSLKPKKGGWLAESAGILAPPHQPPSPAAFTVMKEKKIDISSHRSRLLTPDIAESAAWIVTMTSYHQFDITSRIPGSAPKTRRLGEFGDSPAQDVPDPIGQPVHVYRVVRDVIETYIADLILFLINEQKK